MRFESWYLHRLELRYCTSHYEISELAEGIMEYQDLERELKTVGYGLVLESELAGSDKTAYRIAYAVDSRGNRIRLGVIELILYSGLRKFRQRTVYKYLVRGTKC